MTATLAARRAQWKPPDVPERGWERLYVQHVQQAHLGADLDFLVGRQRFARRSGFPLITGSSGGKMNASWSRRHVLKQLAALSATLVVPTEGFVGEQPTVASQETTNSRVATVSAHTLRLTVLPVKNGKAAEIPFFGALVRESWGAPIATLRGKKPSKPFNPAS